MSKSIKIIISIVLAAFLIALTLGLNRADAAEPSTTYDKSLQPVKVDMIGDVGGWEIHRIVDYQHDKVCYMAKWKNIMDLHCTEGTR